MRGRRGRIAAGLVLCMALLLFGGCSVGGTKIFFASGCGWNDVFKIGGMACSQKEAKVYLMNYKNLYGVVYDTDLWSGDFDTETVENTLKEEVLQYLTRVYTLNVYAKEQDIALDSGEEDAVKQAAAEYYDSLTEAERSYSGASQSDIERMYQRYALAVKVYEQLMESVDEEISEDEARVMDANLIFVTDEARAKRKNMWEEIRQYDKKLYYRLRYSTLSGLTYLPGRLGGRLTVGGYRFARKIYQFQ